MLNSLWKDAAYAIRGLGRNKGFTTVVVVSLALGIGANTTIFSVLNTLLYRPLPYAQPGRLMMIWQKTSQGKTQPPISENLDWKRQSRAFEDVASMSLVESVPVGGAGKPELVKAQFVTANFFRVLGIEPLMGRAFRTEEIHDLTQTIVIGHAFWQHRFGGDPRVLGAKVNVAGVLSTIVGVTPSGFGAINGEPVDLWYPINPAGDRYSRRDDSGWLYVFGRLKSGVTLSEAQAEANIIAARLAATYPDSNKGTGASIEPLHEAFFSGAGESLYPLAGAVGFILLISCVNVATLLLSRTEGRRKEHAVRASLGASRYRFVQQILVESGVLACLGGSLGIALALGGIRLFRLVAGDLVFDGYISIDANVLLFTVAVSALTAILFGSVPAVLLSRPNLNLALREGDRRSMAGGRGRTRQALAVAETACATVLLVGAGLMIRSVIHLKQLDPGFDAHNVMTAEVALPEGGKYLDRVPGGSLEKTSPLVNAFYRKLIERLRALPGVESVGTVSHLLGAEPRAFSVLGRPAPLSGNSPGAGYNEVAGSFFQTLRIPLLRGRYIDSHDIEGTPWVVVINEAFARRYLPDQDPLGQQLRLRIPGYGVDDPQSRQIVGIVGNVRQYGLGREEPELIYTSYLQQPAAYPGGAVMGHIRQEVVLRTSLPLKGRRTEIALAIREAVAGIDPDQPVSELLTMNEVLSESIEDSRFYLRLLGIFSIIAVILAAIGIYGMMAYFVRDRTREIGIRMALGARRTNVFAMVTRLGLTLTSGGIVLGLILATGLTRLLRHLWSVSATDPVTFVAVTLGFLLIALIACYIPARRAMNVDPMVTLRHE